jgi:hypothetical protein
MDHKLQVLGPDRRRSNSLGLIYWAAAQSSPHKWLHRHSWPSWDGYGRTSAPLVTISACVEAVGCGSLLHTRSSRSSFGVLGP